MIETQIELKTRCPKMIERAARSRGRPLSFQPLLAASEGGTIELFSPFWEGGDVLFHTHFFNLIFLCFLSIFWEEDAIVELKTFLAFVFESF